LMFDDVLPPALRVVVPSRLGQQADRIRPLPFGRGVRSHRGWVGRAGVLIGRVGGAAEPVRHRQIHEPHRYGVTHRPAHRHPLRRELGKGPERSGTGGPAGRRGRLWRTVGEQCHGWSHLRGPSQRDEWIRLGWALDEHDVGSVGIQRPPHRPGRAGAVVPDPQQYRAIRAHV
jgi:hypothetical protein